MAAVDQKWRIWTSVLGIFLLGVVAGVFATHLFVRWERPEPPLRYGGGMERMLIKLDLTAEQRMEVEKILQETRDDLVDLRRSFSPEIRKIRLETEQELRKVLTESQWKEFEEMTPRRRGPLRRRHSGPER